MYVCHVWFFFVYRSVPQLLVVAERLDNTVVIEKLQSTIKFDLWMHRLVSMRKLVHTLGGRDLGRPTPTASIGSHRRYDVVHCNLTLGHSLMILVHYVGER